MKQALNSARPRNGHIDEGNMIYLFDLGISGAQAQAETIAIAIALAIAIVIIIIKVIIAGYPLLAE